MALEQKREIAFFFKIEFIVKCFNWSLIVGDGNASCCCSGWKTLKLQLHVKLLIDNKSKKITYFCCSKSKEFLTKLTNVKSQYF